MASMFLFNISGLLASFFCLGAVQAGEPPCTYSNLLIPVSINATTAIPSFPPFADSSATTEWVVQLWNNPNYVPVSGIQNITENFHISARYCTPERRSARSNILQFMTPGFGYDKTYWDWEGSSYVDAALAAGYSTFTWDPLGSGLSSTPDAYTILQAPTDFAVLTTLTSLIRTAQIRSIPAPTKIVHISHSYGSALTQNFMAHTPHLTDGVNLTGFGYKANWTWDFAMIIGGNTIADNQPWRFGGRDTGLLTWPNKYQMQHLYFSYPDFDPNVLSDFEANKRPFTVGQLLTISGMTVPVAGYEGPLFYINGHNDYPYCGGNCDGIISSADIEAFVPNAKEVEVYLHPAAGHAFNLHYNSTGAYNLILAYIGKNIG